MRQFQSGASTGSPLRREARSRNPSGSSAAQRNKDIIEEEDVDMDDGEGLMMRARTDGRAAPTSPTRQQTRRALSPARGYQVNGLPPSSASASQEGGKYSSSSMKSRSKALYDRITRNIDLAFDAREQNLPITASGMSSCWRLNWTGLIVSYYFSSEMAQERPPHPKIFISSWLDYAHKYGMGYALTDGTVGVHFNDSSTMVFAPSKQYVPQVLNE